MNLFQSKDWQKLQEELHEKTTFTSENSFSYLAIQKSTPLGNYLFLPYGPIAKTKADFKAALKSLEALAKDTNSIFIRIEPTNLNFKTALPKTAKKVKDLSPKDTWVLDLTQSKDKLIENFSHGIRNAYNTYEKRGIKIETTKDLDEIKHLVKLQASLFKTKNIQTFSEDYLKAELNQPFATLYLAKYIKDDHKDNKERPEKGEILAASLFFDYKDTRYYMQSAAANHYKNLPSTVAILTNAIFDAKEKGIKYFDFWGIAPDDAPESHPWTGFTKFKKSFGGEAKHYLGTYDIVLKPAKYKLYQLTRKINLILRHI